MTISLGVGVCSNCRLQGNLKSISQLCGVHLQLVDTVVDSFGHFYPELVAKRDTISEIIRQNTPQPQRQSAHYILVIQGDHCTNSLSLILRTET